MIVTFYANCFICGIDEWIVGEVSGFTDLVWDFDLDFRGFESR